MLKYLILIIILAFIINANTSLTIAQVNTQNNIQQQQMLIPKSSKVLALSRTNLDTLNTKIGDNFCAKIVENLIIGKNVIIPCNSIVYGQVLKVKKPQRLNRNGKIILSINQIQTPDGKLICLQGSEIKGVIVSAYEESLKKRIGKKIPPEAAGYSTSIPLGQATNLNGGIVYALSTGASMVGGAVTGIFTPDIGKSRLQSFFLGGLNASPIGTAYNTIRKGKDAGINTGDSLLLTLNKATIIKIQDQYAAQKCAASQTAAR